MKNAFFRAAVLLSACFAHAAPAMAEPTGCPDFEVELPRKTAGETVLAADYGFSTTNDDNAAAINRALAACRERKAARLVLAPGTYRCFGPKGVEIDGLEDFTLDGRGAVLVFWRKLPNDWDAKKGEYAVGECANLRVVNCRRTLVTDLTCDWDWDRHPLAFWGRVVGKHLDEREGESYVDFRLDGYERYPLYPNPVPVQLIMPKGRLDGRGCRVYCEMGGGAFGSKNEWISPNTLRVWVWVAQPDRPHGGDANLRFTKGKNRGACTYIYEGEVFAVSHHYYGMSGLDLAASEHVTMRNVRLWSARGHGVGIGEGMHHLAFEGFRLAPPTEAEAKAAGFGWHGPRPVTSTSDGTHCRRSRGFFKFTDCEWTLNNDDCVNFHDCTGIARREGERFLRVVNPGGTPYLGAAVGHTIELMQENYEPTGWKGRVVALDYGSITVDRPLPKQTGRLFVVYDREYSTDNLLFRNCRFHRAPWARNLILANNVTFDGCRFEEISGAPLRFQTCYTPNVWCEGMGATNVVVRGCAFRNCAAAFEVQGVSSQIFLGLRIPSHRGWPESGVAPIYDEVLRRQYEEMCAAKGALDVRPWGGAVGRLLVENNEFVNPRGYLVNAFNGDGVVVRNNRTVFDGKAPYALLSEAGGIRVDGATNVRAYGNVETRTAEGIDGNK